MAVFRKGEDYVDFAARYGLDPDQLARANNYNKPNAGMNVRLPQITKVGENGFEYAVATDNGVRILSHEESKMLEEQGVRAGQGMARGGFIKAGSSGGGHGSSGKKSGTDTSYRPGLTSAQKKRQERLKEKRRTSLASGTPTVGAANVGTVAPKVNQTQTAPPVNPFAGVVASGGVNTGYNPPYTIPHTNFQVPNNAAIQQPPNAQPQYTIPHTNFQVPNKSFNTTASGGVNTGYKPPRPTTVPGSYYDAGLGVTSQGPTPQNTYYDSGLNVVSQGPTKPPAVNTGSGNLGSFTDTNISLWDSYFNNPTSLSDHQIAMINNELASDQYTEVYGLALQDFLNGQNDVYRSIHAVPIPDAVLGQIDIAYLDSKWYDSYYDILAGMGYSHDEIAAEWLGQLGYEFSDSGMFMEYNEENAPPLPDSSGNSPGYTSHKNNTGYGGYGGNREGYANYSSALNGLVNWRGVGFA